MQRILKSDKGSTMIIVLMVIVVLGIIAPIGYSWFNKLYANDNRLIYQKQAVNLSVSAMETFQKQTDDKVNYLSDYTFLPNEPKIVQNGTSMLDLYQYAVDDQGTPMDESEIQTYSGEYTIIVRAVAGDRNHDAVKDPGEDFFYEHEMTAKESTSQQGTGEVILELEDGKTVKMTFQELINQYDREHPVLGDLFIYGVGEGGYFTTDDRIEIAATGSVTIDGSFVIESSANGEGKSDSNNLEVISETADIVIHQGSLISTGNSARRDIILEAPQGNIFVNGGTMEARRDIRLYAGMNRSGSLTAPGKNIVLDNTHFETKKSSQLILKASGNVIEH